MAVSTENDQSSTSNLDLKQNDSNNSGRSCSSPSNNNGVMNVSKKDRRKPEIQLYRPGMGLQNKTLKLSDSNEQFEKGDDIIKIDSSVSCNKQIKNSQQSFECSTKKPVKTKRPDVQVYIPKAKVAAQLNDKKPECKNVPRKNLNNVCSSKSQALEKDHQENDKCISKSSPQPLGSWADLMDESDRSNSRSASVNGNIALENAVKGSDNKDNLNMSNDTLKTRRRRRSNSLRQEAFQSNKKESKNITVSENNITGTIKACGESNKLNFEKNKRLSKIRHASGNSIVSQKYSEVKNFPFKNDKTTASTQDISNCNGNSRNFSDNRARTEKKRHDKMEIEVPPRFQKSKKLIDSTFQQSTSGTVGGILKLPVEPDSPSIPPLTVDTSFYIPEPKPQTFIHKQLFDPNNPSQPEIVNIPAPIPQLHSPYPKALYYDPSYISAPVQSTLNYIPPPQPASVNPFLHPEINGLSPSSNRLDPAYMRSFNEIPSILEPGKKRLKPIVEKNLHEIVLLEKELLSLISKGFNCSDSNSNSLKQCRWKLQLRYENIILADPKYCAEKNPEQSLWKTVFHQIIELLRKKLEEDGKDQEKIKEHLLNIILEGSMFYENLLEKQQETYGFKLTKVLELEFISSAALPEQLRCVLISVQKSLIFLGDLARYKEQVCQTTNYGKARSWYLKAQQIAPKNGRPYHQLALLALNTRRKLDAVYYYMRSLAASNPFLSAKESLLSLFEEAKRKYEQYEKKQQKEKEPTVKEEKCELWIKPDGSSGPLDQNVDSLDMKNLSDVELNKRFVTSFLHVHGKLFTKVGMETFPDTLNHMLKEYYTLLHRTPLPLTSTRILQLLAINIFSVTNSSLKENGRELGSSSMLQEQALLVSMIMMTQLMERCRVLHAVHKTSPKYASDVLPDDLAQLLPAVKIWTDWMSCQKCLWAPPSVWQHLDGEFDKDIWTAFADLCTVLGEIDTSHPVIVQQRVPDSDPIILDEDCTYAGFVPLLGALHSPAFGIQPFDKERAKHSLRISRIQFFGDYLCGITPAYMEFDISSKKFVSLVKQLSLEESFERSVLLSSTDESYKEDVSEAETTDNCYSRGGEMQDLWCKKVALSREKEQQEKHKAQVQAVLHSHQRPIRLKIKPRYLIPDTNCFIDHLPLFKNILASTDFHLIIPLVVINELDGLGRGTPEHSSRVGALSREAITFLESEFATRQPHLRAITSQGSILDTISFRSEEMGNNKGTNDDLILTCCLHYCKDRAEQFMPKNRDDPVILFREVVLLTDDRNLRVKALAHHVPVRDLLSFLQWANS